MGSTARGHCSPRALLFACPVDLFMSLFLLQLNKTNLLGKFKKHTKYFFLELHWQIELALKASH